MNVKRGGDGGSGDKAGEFRGFPSLKQAALDDRFSPLLPLLGVDLANAPEFVGARS